MPRGGKRPGSGAKKGSVRGQKSPEDIAERRRLVRSLSLVYRRAAEIREAIQREQPHLLEGLRSPHEAILNDLARIRENQAEELRDRSASHVIGDYVENKDQLRRMVLSQMDQLQGPAKVRAIQVASDLIDDAARALGMPMDRPVLPLDLGQLSENGEPADGNARTGIIDALTFATDPRFCGLKLDKFPMQLRVLEEFMAPLSRYRTLVLVCGMRAGKGVVCSILAWYAAYELLSLESPQRYFGLTPDQEIQIVNLAASQAQARNGLFKHMLDRLQSGGTWFASVRDKAKITGLEIRLPKNIVIRCGHSRASTLVGATSYMVLLDELARFKDTDGRDNADYVYEQMSATTATFQDCGRVLVLSSPEWEGDKAMRLLEEATEVDADRRPVRPFMMGLQMETWEANLTYTQEWLWRRFDGDANPRAFWRDFGARPPMAVEGYYPDPGRWERQADPDRHHPFDDHGRLVGWFSPCCDSRRFVHVDLGLSRDACGFAMAHKPVPGCPYYHAKETRPNPKAKKVVLDLCGRFLPGPTGEISFESVRQLIRDLQDRGFNVKGGGVTFDGWQSVDSQQILRKEGFRSEMLSVDRDLGPHDTLQELLNTNEVSFYRHDVLLREARELQLRKGAKVDHPVQGSKDMIDAVAGAVFQAFTKGGRVTFVG